MMCKHGTIEELCNIEYGTRIIRRNEKGDKYPVYGGGGETFRTDKVNRKNRLVISRFAMSHKCTRFVSDDFFLNDSGLTLSPSRDDLTQNYLDKIMLGLNDKIYSLGRGTAQTNLDMERFKKISFSYPPLPEQEKIVTKLDKAFTETDKAIIAIKAKQKEIEALKSATIRDYFDSSKKTWKTEKLGDICDVKRGRTITRRETKEGSVPVIAGGVKPAYYHNKSNREANCITVSGSGANAGFVNFWDVPIYASDCSTIQPLDETQNIRFVYFYMLSKQQYIYDNFRSGTAQPHVYAKDIATLKYPLLALPEQEKIVTKLDKAFSEAEKLEVIYKKQIEDLHHLKSSFLRQELQSEGA